jgi:hypothetical protein
MTQTTMNGANELRRNSLGLLAVTFMVISAAAPLTGVAGAVPIAFLIGNGTGVPATFLFMTLVMLAFAAGYVATPMPHAALADTGQVLRPLRPLPPTMPCSSD